MKKLKILITGANRGLGLAMTKHALSLGHNVIACRRASSNATNSNEMRDAKVQTKPNDLDLAKIDELDHLQSIHSESLFIESLDLMKTDSFERFAQKLSTRFADGQLDILMNVAGVLIDQSTSDAKTNFSKLTEDDLLTSYKVNAIAPLLLSRALFKNLQKSESPKIVFFTSQMGSIEDNSSGGYYAYRSSKAALNMLQKSLSIDFSDLKILAVHPGWVRTRMGGKNATLDADGSVAAIWQQITLMTKENSGKFVNYDGKQIKW